MSSPRERFTDDPHDPSGFVQLGVAALGVVTAIYAAVRSHRAANHRRSAAR